DDLPAASGCRAANRVSSANGMCDPNDLGNAECYLTLRLVFALRLSFDCFCLAVARRCAGLESGFRFLIGFATFSAAVSFRSRCIAPSACSPQDVMFLMT